MEGNDKKLNINIKLGGLKPMSTTVSANEEVHYRQAETWVNTVYAKWSTRNKGLCTSEEIFARVAFQFAKAFSEASTQQTIVQEQLAELERKLDEIVVKS